MKFVVVDMQGFSIPEFFPKEVAIYDGERTAHFLVKSPTSLSEIENPSIISQIKVLQTRVHGLFYGSGDVPYESLPVILNNYLQDVDRVYVKGTEKQRFLHNVLLGWTCPAVINVEYSEGCPKLEKQPAACFTHTCISAHKPTKCSINNCKTLYSWLYRLLP